MRWTSMVTELEEVPMSIVGGLDIHRKQLTFDWVDEQNGKWERGRITPADREPPRRLADPVRPGRGRTSGVRDGRLHRLAVHRRRDGLGGRDRASGRAGRHLRAARPETPRQN